MTYVDAWKTFAEVSGGSAPIGAAGPVILRAAGLFGDLLTKLTGIEGDVNSGGIEMSQLFHYYDSSRAQRELDYQIPPIKDSAADAWTWFQEFGYVKK